MNEPAGKARRHEYKRVWSALSQSWESARNHVIGDAGEAEIQRQADHTCSRLCSSIGILPEHRVLEIGCGIGRVAQAMAGRCRHWTGMDVSPEMLRYARERLDSYPNVTLLENDGYNLRPVEDASQERVYCTVVFMHLDEWERFGYTSEAFRVLTPGGRFYADNFSLCHPDGWAFFLEHFRMPPEQRPPHISKSSTPQELRVYFERAGFVDIEQRQTGLWIETWGAKPQAGERVK